MTKTIDIPESIDNSTALQKLIDSTGNTPTQYNFTSDHEIEINSLLRFYNYTTVSGDGCTFTLMDNAPIKTFGLQVPLIGAKTVTGVTGLYFKNFKMRGNYKNQAPTLKADGSDHGKGRHNQIGLGNMSDPQYSCVTHCTFENLDMGYSYGDQIRINGGSDLTFKDITCNLGGHDIIHLSAVNRADISGLKAPNIRTNNAVRTRSSSNIYVHDCEVTYGSGYDTGPAFQSESITKNRVSEHIYYYNNIIKNLKGAAFYIVADKTASDVQIYNNLILGCGQLEAAIKIPYVGGATILGWDDAKFYNNTLVNCRGYGVADATFAYKSSQTGSIDVYRNIITGMEYPYTRGTGDGSPIAHLTGSQTTFNVYENCLYDNARDLYNVTNKNGITVNPLFVGSGDYHLKENSPCRKSGYQLGCYSGTTETPADPEETDTAAKVIIEGTEAQLNTLMKSLSQEYPIYWRN